MTDGELHELFGVAELSKPYAYANIHVSSNSITPMLRVLLLPTVWSPTDELLAWAGLALTEEGNGGSTYGRDSMPAASTHFNP